VRYRFGDCEVDSQKFELVRAGQPVAVEPLVFKLLIYLLEHRDRAVGKDEILARIWTGKVVSDATLANAIKLARQAVGDSGERQAVIRTVRGHGYRFVAPIAASAPAAPDLPLAASAEALPVLPDRPSIALLSFENLGGHEAADILAEGLAVDLNARLARLHGLFVIAHNSARRFSAQQLSLREIGQRLGVRYLAYGTTQRSGQRIRVTINLAEVEHQQTIWSEQFERVLDDVFVVQDDIVNAIVAALLPELERAEMDRCRLLPTGHLGAWECYHRAMWHNFRFTADDSLQAEALLRKACELDPLFARARAGLSFNHFLHAFLDTDRDPVGHARRSLEYARESVVLDERDALSHWVLGRALYLSGEHDQALRALDRALLANPNFAQGRYARGFVQVHSGDGTQALADLDSARRLSPYDPLLFAMKSCRAMLLAAQGDPVAAADWAVAATEEPNAHFHIHAIAGACLQMTGAEDSARVAVGRALDMHPGYSQAVFERSFLHRDPAHRALFREALLRAGLPQS